MGAFLGVVEFVRDDFASDCGFGGVEGVGGVDCAECFLVGGGHFLGGDLVEGFGRAGGVVFDGRFKGGEGARGLELWTMVKAYLMCGV